MGTLHNTVTAIKFDKYSGNNLWKTSVQGVYNKMYSYTEDKGECAPTADQIT